MIFIMEVKKITDPAFRKYGRIVKEIDFSELLEMLRNTTKCPAEGTIYVPSDPALEGLPVYKTLQTRTYGEMPIQIGYCNGHNQKLNALEYHRDSEINVMADDAILILGLRADVTDDFTYETAKCEAFLVPAGTAVEVFATSLHYAPVGPGGNGFRVIVVLPRGTNTELKGKHNGGEDTYLTAVNKWLLRHEECQDADCPAGLVGENITIR